MTSGITAPERTFGISDLATEFGITARAIRFYEDKGLLTPRREGQRRIFGQRDRVRLMLILRGKRLGFSLREIQEIIDLYDNDFSGTRQLKLLLAKIQERRESLLSQRADIDLTLDEIDRLEAQCRSIVDGDGT